MPITLPSFVAPNELIQSAWGNGVVNALDELDDEKLDLTGGTLTGNLLLNGAVVRAGNTTGSQFTVVDTSGGNTAYVAYFGDASSISSLGTRSGYIGYAAANDMQVRNEIGAVQLASDIGAITFLPSLVERARVNSAGVLVNKTASSGATAGAEMLVTGRFLSTLDADSSNLYVNKIGSAVASDAVFANFLLSGTTMGSIMRHGATSELRVNSDESMHLRTTTGAVLFEPAGTEQARMQSTAFLVSKTASNVGVSGVELLTSGRVFSTLNVDDSNVFINKIGSAVVSGAIYASFALTGSTIGSISRNAATSAVLYNTTSDARHKTVFALDDDDGLATIARIPIRRYERDGANGVQSVGVIAQELAEVIPNAVTPGGDDPDTQPWQVAYSDENIIGHLTLAVQQLAARIEKLDKKPKK